MVVAQLRATLLYRIILRMMLFSRTLPDNNKLFSGRVPDYKKLFPRRVLDTIKLVSGTLLKITILVWMCVCAYWVGRMLVGVCVSVWVCVSGLEFVTHKTKLTQSPTYLWEKTNTSYPYRTKLKRQVSSNIPIDLKKLANLFILYYPPKYLHYHQLRQKFVNLTLTIIYEEKYYCEFSTYILYNKAILL